MIRFLVSGTPFRGLIPEEQHAISVAPLVVVQAEKGLTYCCSTLRYERLERFTQAVERDSAESSHSYNRSLSMHKPRVLPYSVQAMSR